MGSVDNEEALACWWLLRHGAEGNLKKENEMDGACGMRGKEEGCVQDFDGESCREETT